MVIDPFPPGWDRTWYWDAWKLGREVFEHPKAQRRLVLYLIGPLRLTHVSCTSPAADQPSRKS